MPRDPIRILIVEDDEALREALLDTALMLMRETASEITFDDAAVDREKGIILSERRVRRYLPAAQPDRQSGLPLPRQPHFRAPAHRHDRNHRSGRRQCPARALPRREGRPFGP